MIKIITLLTLYKTLIKQIREFLRPNKDLRLAFQLNQINRSWGIFTPHRQTGQLPKNLDKLRHGRMHYFHYLSWGIESNKLSSTDTDYIQYTIASFVPFNY